MLISGNNDNVVFEEMGAEIYKDQTSNTTEKKMTFIESIRHDEHKKRIVEDGMIAAVNVAHTVAPILARVYRNKKIGIPGKVVNKDDIPGIVNAAISSMFVVDDVVFGGKLQQKFPVIGNVRTASLIFASVPAIKKVVNTYIKVQKKDNSSDIDYCRGSDYYNLIPLLSSFFIPVVFDNSVSLKGTLMSAAAVIGGQWVTKTIARTGNVKAIKAAQTVKNIATIGTRVLNDNVTQQMVSSSQNQMIREGTDKLGAVSSFVATMLNGGNPVGNVYRQSPYGWHPTNMSTNFGGRSGYNW